MVSSGFSELRSFSLGVHCGSGPFLFSVIGRTSFWLAAPTSRAPWGLVAGRRVLSFLALAVWTSARRRFRSLGVPFLRKGSLLFLFRGFFFPPHSEPGVFSCSRQFGLKSSQSQIRGQVLAFSDVFTPSQGFLFWPVCVAQALLQPSFPVFHQDRGFTLVCSDSLASAADGVAFFFLRLVSPLEVFFFPVPGLTLRRRLLQ